MQNSKIRLRSGKLGKIFIGLIIVFLVSTIFDPGDKVLGLKVPLYLACWAFGLFACKNTIKCSGKLVIYVLLMIAIPMLSISYYYLIDGSEPYKGFELLKGYLFMTFALLIYITSIDILKYLSAILTLLAVSILMLTAVYFSIPELRDTLYLLGHDSGTFSIDRGRDYGSGVVMFQMYFVTSPMLAISIAYYFDLAKDSSKNRKYYLLLLFISIFAMLIAGSRNNILAATILPAALYVMYSKNKARALFGIFLLSTSLIFIWKNQIFTLFDPSETSNASKLIMLQDYSNIFSDPYKLLFGSGLGAYEYWTEKGFTYITEITYFEVIRNYGLLLGVPMLLLLAYPIFYAFILRPNFKEKNIALGYLAYLIMCMSNPNLFGSMGMLFLAILMVKIAIHDAKIKKICAEIVNNRSGMVQKY